MNRLKIFILVILILMPVSFVAQNRQGREIDTINAGMIVNVAILDGDTLPYFPLPVYYCFPRMKFKSKKQEKFYWRTVRDVKKVLPLSIYIQGVIEKTNETLMTLPNKASRDVYMKRFEKRMYAQHKDEFKKLTLNQGKLLIRLIDRQTNYSSYELIKAYRGSFRAGFWQMFAKIFGADLKSEFGSKEDDEIVERIIILVEAGQL